jgi:hypothetical protein
MTISEAQTRLKLSIQRALLGEVTEQLVSVTCGIKDHTLRIQAFFSGEVKPGDIERIQMIGTEVTADFPEGYWVEEDCKSVDEAEEEMLDFWVFRRAELNNAADSPDVDK